MLSLTKEGVANGVQRNPPGSGKSWLAPWFAYVAMIFNPPITDIDEKLRSNLETIQELANDDEEQLLEFVRSNRTWLDPPPPEMDENNPFGEPVRLRGHRINVPSKLWPAQTHVWKLRVPVDKSTGNAKLPLILDLPDPSADDSGNPLKSIRGFTDQCLDGNADVKVKIVVIDSDKTYKAEMNALKKLMAPHAMPMNDRPSLTSINAVEDLITAKFRDGKQLKEFMTELEKLRQGSHENARLQAAYKRLGRDKMNACRR